MEHCKPTMNKNVNMCCHGRRAVDPSGWDPRTLEIWPMGQKRVIMIHKGDEMGLKSDGEVL